MSHCSCLFLIYGSETMIWKEKAISRIRAVQMDNLRSLLSSLYKEMDKVPNVRIRELCGGTRGLMKVLSDGPAMYRE